MCKASKHDFELFKENLNSIPKESFVLADNGYQGVYDKSLIPLKAKKEGEVSSRIKNL